MCKVAEAERMNLLRTLMFRMQLKTEVQWNTSHYLVHAGRRYPWICFCINNDLAPLLFILSHGNRSVLTGVVQKKQELKWLYKGMDYVSRNARFSAKIRLGQKRCQVSSQCRSFKSDLIASLACLQMPWPWKHIFFLQSQQHRQQLKICLSWPHFTSADLDILYLRPENLCFSNHCRWLRCILLLKNHVRRQLV